MKRLICILLSLMLVLSLCACAGDTNQPTDEPSVSQGSDTPSTPSDSANVSKVKIPENLPKKKVGAVGVYSGNELYVQWKNNLSSLGELFNVEFQFVEPSSTEEYASAIESLVISGVDGIISQICTESLVKLCAEKNVGYMVYCSVLPQDMMDTVSQYDNFCGVVAEDDSVAARHAAESMYEAGCREVGLIGVARGLSELMDTRADSFKARFEELGGKVIAEDYSYMEFGKGVSTFAAAYPNMDGIFSCILNEVLFQAIATEGLAGNIKIAGFDLSESCPDFFESGDLVYACTGQQAAIVCAFAPLYNYMYDGTHLVEDRAHPVARPFAEVHNYEEYQDYDAYVRYSTCYSPEEIAEMILGWNSDYTPQDFIDINAAFSIQEVKERSGQ